MRDVRHRFAGPLPQPRRERFKNAFTLPGPPAPPPAPTPLPPPPMPDPNSPAALAAKQKAMADVNKAGRSATTLTTAAMGAGNTLAGAALGQKLGAR